MRTAPLLLVALALAGCTSAPHPCRVGPPEPAPRWPRPSVWQHRELPEPAGGWVGSFALSPDGARAVYLDQPGGNYIPVSDLVSMIRIDLGPETNPALMELPGEALRNFAWLSWGPHGLAWASWSSLGVADPDGPSVKRLWHLPGPRAVEERPAFPMLTSVAWAPGGDCLAAVVALPEDKAQLIAFNAGGASAPAHQWSILPLEAVEAWEGKGCLLLRRPVDGAPSARWIDPLSGTTLPADPPDPTAQALTRVGEAWLTVSASGEIKWGGKTVALVPHSLTAKPGQKHLFDQIGAAGSGATLAVDEAVSGPSFDAHYLHVLTSR